MRVPLLCVNALDDPIAPKEAIPREAFGPAGGNPHLMLATTPTGGHLGWLPLLRKSTATAKVGDKKCTENED